MLKGELGPVLRRWVSGAILPVAARLREVSKAVLAGDGERAAALVESPVFGLPGFTSSPDLHAVLRWGLKSDYAADLVLAALGTTIQACAASSPEPIPLTRALASAANAARETALGQFLTQVQGAKALDTLRRSKDKVWKQRKAMNAVGALMAGQVRSALDSTSLYVNGRDVVTVLMSDGERRRIDLRRPEAGDWALLEVARRTSGERDAHLSTWCSFAMVVLCCAQAEAGWFDLVKIPPKTRRKMKAAHGLILAEEAYQGVKADIDRWLHMGFSIEPMLAPPEGGDYLSVKHRAVAGGRGPLGMRTTADDSAAWNVASEAIAKTAWTVPADTLAALRDSEFVQSLAAKSEPDELRRGTILAAYRRQAASTFYMPIYMDFRGRIYTRGSEVTYQGGDLQKGLLAFPQGDGFGNGAALAMHVSGLYGNGLDKAPARDRIEWFRDLYRAVPQLNGDALWDVPSVRDVLEAAEEPVQLLTAMTLTARGEDDRVPIQLDGTCNGLQHLTALFRDETAAPYVNLVRAGFETAPADLYGEVARKVIARIATIDESWAYRVRCYIKIDRKLCKRPVMILPYGATRASIEDSMLEGILAQAPTPHPWLTGRDVYQTYPDWEAGNYAAFKDRPLDSHPLMRLDSQRLGGLVWDAIVETLPKAMAAMATFRRIAKYVGPRSIEWRTPFALQGHDALWVVQAKAKSERTGLKFKGIELPQSVRSLQIRAGRDEVDAHAHISGIVANYIHSLDASHLAHTGALFMDAGGTGMGAIHDCLLSRPSETHLMASAVREAFLEQYRDDPLRQPVRLREPKTGAVESFESWYALAAAAGAEFPEAGKWRASEVTDSAWFFS